MSLLGEYYSAADTWVRHYLLMISMAQVATLLVVFGDRINAVVRGVVNGYPFMLRMSAFVALCTFGYGAFAALMTPLYKSFLVSLDKGVLIPVIVISFVAIGVITERGIK